MIFADSRGLLKSSEIMPDKVWECKADILQSKINNKTLYIYFLVFEIIIYQVFQVMLEFFYQLIEILFANKLMQIYK